ncbi:carboxypeptidase-like regulatory domain-containing protein [[Eubacterium] cellulosolvens]
MNGKDLKYILPLAVVVIIILAVLGAALMSGPKKDGGAEEEEGPYTMSVGPVTDEENKPVQGAIVILKNGGGKVESEVTDAEGIATFSFDEKLNIGEYTILITKKGFEDIEINTTLDYDGEKIVLAELEEDIPIELPPEVLPPVEFSVGPIKGKDELMVDIAVELKHNFETIKNETTDENGVATFTFKEPPVDGLYEIYIYVEDYELMEIEISLIYNKDTHTLTVIGDLTDIELKFIEPPPPPEPIDDPEYYKQLDAYQELEGVEEPPVDPEEELDPDGDGSPEYYDDIEAETPKEGMVTEDYLPMGDEGNPEYSPEISEYEPVDYEPHLEGQLRQSRGADGSGSGTRAEEVNLTHYEDFIDKNKILDNSTEKLMTIKAESENIVDPNMATEFGKEVVQVPIILAASLAINFINGSNSSDSNNDSNPEHLVIWKVVKILHDFNNDNITDKKVVAFWIVEMFDNNSNGVFEKSRALGAAMIAWDNNSDRHFEDVKYAVALGEETKIDGNYTEHYKKMGILYNHTIDANNDSIYESQRAAVYFEEHYDNNSNGYYELIRKFGGGFEGIDKDSNGMYEKVLWIWGGNELKDLNDDNTTDQNRSIAWIYTYTDENEDSKYEHQALLMIVHELYDNNSNGYIEDNKTLIAGFRLIDENSDGNPEQKAAAIACVRQKDENDAGTVDSSTAVAMVFLWTDSNGDKTPESQRALVYVETRDDKDSDGNIEDRKQVIAGFEVKDKNSDGKPNEVFALHYGVHARDQNDDGTMDHNESAAYLIHLVDNDGDKILEKKRALFGYENKWDNNTDGKFEAVNQFFAGYEGLDNDDDGNLDEERWFIIVNVTRDANNDGRPENSTFGIWASYKKYNATGGIVLARNVVHWAVALDNDSDGNHELIRYVLLGHKGINGTQNGSKIDWENETGLIFVTQLRDNDDNGTWDDLKLWVRIEFP